MRLSRDSRLREKREREFQTRVLAALETLARPRRVGILNRPFVLWMLSAVILSFGGWAYGAYHQCITEARAISAIYAMYGYEIFYRQDEILQNVNDATTVSGLRKALQKKTYFNSDLKDKPIAELLPIYREAYLRIDRSALDSTAERAMMSSSGFARFNVVFDGHVPSDMKDTELSDLKQFALFFSLAHLTDFVQRVGAVYDYVCTPHTIWRIALGGSPVLVRVRVGFAEREKRDLRIDEK